MKKTYALDTNTISYLLRGEGDVDMHFQREIIWGNNSYAIPYIVVYEVKRWLNDDPTKQKREFAKAFDELFQSVEKNAELSVKVWDKAADIYIQLKKSGQLIGDADILIAAYCLVNDCTLVTRNKSDFLRISGLKLVNWYD